MLNYFFDINKKPVANTLYATYDFSTSLPAGASLTRASTGLYSPTASTVASAAIDAPRFEANGLLGEADRTNYIPYSNEFSEATRTYNFTGAGATKPALVSTNNPSPMAGDNTASNITFNKGSGAGYSLITKALSGLTSSKYAVLFWGKSNTAGNQNVLVYNPAQSAYDGNVKIFTPVWQPFFLNKNTTNNANPAMVFGTRGTYDGVTTYLGGDITLDILIWQSMICPIDYPTPIVPTAGASATRAKDIVGLTKPVAFSDSLGSIVIQVATNHLASTAINWIIDFGNATGVYVEGATYKFTDGTNVTTIGTATNTGAIDKIGVGFGSSVVTVAINGTGGANGTFDNNLSSGASFFIEQKSDGTLQLDGNLKNIKFYSDAKTAAQLATLTT